MDQNMRRIQFTPNENILIKLIYYYYKIDIKQNLENIYLHKIYTVISYKNNLFFKNSYFLFEKIQSKKTLIMYYVLT